MSDLENELRKLADEAAGAARPLAMAEVVRRGDRRRRRLGIIRGEGNGHTLDYPAEAPPGRRWPSWVPPVAAAVAVAAVVAGAVTVAGSFHGHPQVIAAATTGAGGSGTVYVVNQNSDTVIPINAATDKPGQPIKVGHEPQGIAITPDGKTAYVTSGGKAGLVTPINTATNQPGKPIATGGSFPEDIAITPNGKMAYVTNSKSGTVTPIRLSTNTALPPIPTGQAPWPLAIAPDGKTVYVVNEESHTVTPVDVATGKAGKPISVGGETGDHDIVITPDGRMAYVDGQGGDLSETVVPIRLSTNTALPAITIGEFAGAMAVTPDSKTLYVASLKGLMTPVNTATGQLGKPIRTGQVGGDAIAITADGKTAYVVNGWAGVVVPVRLAHGTVLPKIPVQKSANFVAITPDGRTVYVVGSGNGKYSVAAIRTATNKALPLVAAGINPSAFAITP